MLEQQYTTGLTMSVSNANRWFTPPSAGYRAISLGQMAVIFVHFMQT